jgi:hypothetical protein
LKIKTINTIELSSICDNACAYCPAKDQGEYRQTGFMDVATFEKAIVWALRFAKEGTQLEINLFGVGESTLHPKLVQFVAYARRMMPFGQVLHLNTNGNTMTEELAQSIKDAGISHIDISGHDHRATANCLRIFRKVGIPHGLSYDFTIHPNNWAGQVDWFPAKYDAGPCPWLSRGQAMVMSDGRVTTCCIDAFAKNVMGTVDDDLSQLEINPSELCKTCHHMISRGQCAV